MEAQKTEKFIELVKSHEMLWNRSHPFYKDVKQKAIMWKKIGDKFGVSYDVVRIKWKNLRDTYSRCLKKKVPGQATEDPEFSWKHTKAMDFLKDQFKSKKTVSNYSSLAVEELTYPCKPEFTDQFTLSSSNAENTLTPCFEPCDVDEAVWKTSASEENSIAESLASTSSGTSGTSKRKLSSIEQSLLSTMECVQQYLKKPKEGIVAPLPSSSAVNSEDEFFCRSMLEKLSTFPTELRNEAKIEMMRYLCSLQSQLLRSNAGNTHILKTDPFN